MGNLKELRTRIMPAAGVNLPLVQLISSPDEAPYDWTAAGDKRTYGALTSDVALKEIAGYAAGVGPYKRWIIDDQGRTTDFVSRAHDAGLLVHPGPSATSRPTCCRTIRMTRRPRCVRRCVLA
ncbi:hypothetical protein ACFSC4_14660 [Deinococcus malanensis]|uniref:hypothetical protein n=1 Tax=Deinococcus malanensis TaxID=1706855 RepID=UPI00363502B4